MKVGQSIKNLRSKACGRPCYSWKLSIVHLTFFWWSGNIAKYVSPKVLSIQTDSTCQAGNVFRHTRLLEYPNMIHRCKTSLCTSSHATGAATNVRDGQSVNVVRTILNKKWKKEEGGVYWMLSKTNANSDRLLRKSWRRTPKLQQTHLTGTWEALIANKACVPCNRNGSCVLTSNQPAEVVV